MARLGLKDIARLTYAGFAKLVFTLTPNGSLWPKMVRKLDCYFLERDFFFVPWGERD